MFSCRLLLRTGNTFCITKNDKWLVSCKCTASGKLPNVIKTFNTENKNLFGSLLESKTKRRKKLKEPAVNPDLTLITKTSATTNLEVLDHNEALSKKRNSKKPKDIETVSTGLSENILTGCSHNSNQCEDVFESNVSISNLSEMNSQKSNKSKTVLVNAQDPLNKKSTIFSTEKLILKSVVPEGETSYPKDNPDKIFSTKDSQNYESTTFLSDKFISKPAVPVNENSYPLDNPKKLELSTNSCSLENVLNLGFTDPLVKHYMRFPSVSKIMEDTMSPTSRMVLSKWRKNMVADLGEEGFEKHCTALKERGHEFHEAVRNAVLGRSAAGCHSQVTRNALRSLEWVLGLVTKPLAVESIIAHPHLQYKGIPDCVAMFRGVPVVIDWKLSEKPKKDLKDTYDAPVQITAYMGALNHDPNYKWKVSHGLVAVAYTSGDPSDVFLLAPKHCQIYWRHWLLRFHKFNARSHLHVDHQIDEKALESV